MLAATSKPRIGLPTVIYDLGSNNGDDVAYYLKKADTVVAVEANPALATEISRRFSDEIAAGRRVVENCVITTSSYPDEVTFYVHRTNHVLSQFPRPDDSIIHHYDAILLPAKSVVDLVRAHGEPLYVKIDVEHFDQVVLADLFAHNIRPPYISAEAHTIEVFSLLFTAGRYRAFKLVDGPTVARQYKAHTIKTVNGEARHSFPHHSAGPFGEDIPGGWMTPDNFFRFLAFEELGWKDIHATSLVDPDPSLMPSLVRNYMKAASRRARTSIQSRCARCISLARRLITK